MRLSKRTEYGLRAAVRLASAWPAGYVLARELAKEEELPRKFLEAILQALQRGGFIESKVGAGGGHRLARSPREVRVGDLVRRLEGRLSARENDVRRDAGTGTEAVRIVNERLTDTLDEALNDLTLEDLVEQAGRAKAGAEAMYYI